MVFLPGSYNLYYGTEILTEGGYDPDSRRTFDWAKTDDTEIREYMRKISDLLALKRQAALKCGEIKVYAENGLFVIERKANNQTLKLIIDKTDNSYKIESKGRLI